MSTSNQAELLALAERYLYANYRPAPFVLVRGRGCEVWDADGKRYLDLTAGIAVTALGHAHPKYVAAVSEQVGRIAHMSNNFYTEPNIVLAAELCRRTGMDRAFFCNSGTEANEALLKLARHYFYGRGEVGRYRMIAFEEAFHGRTLGALGLTGRAKYREGFGPFGGGVTHVRYGDLDAVRAAMGPDVAAILVEPVQGEGGVLPAPPGFLAGLRSITEEHGALLLVDEVQTGVGRTGSFLAVQLARVTPDAVALAKGLGGGFPIGAMLCRERLATALPPGTHGTTFGGNALASAAALATLAVLDDEQLIDAARAKGEYLGRKLTALTARYPRHFGPERGLGLLRALPLLPGTDPRMVLTGLRDKGILLTISGDTALRFTPPLVVTLAQLDEAIECIEQVVAGLKPSTAV